MSTLLLQTSSVTLKAPLSKRCVRAAAFNAHVTRDSNSSTAAPMISVQPVHPAVAYAPSQHRINSELLHTSTSRGKQLLSALAVAAALPLLLWPVAADAKLPPIKDPASNVGFLTNKEVDKRRKRANFVRAYDGHISIQNKYTKAWVDVKCDLQVPGLLLLRDASGEVFYLGYGGLKQVDLSDDQVVAAIAVDDWENAMIPVEGPGEGGVIERLEMTREGFYQLVSLTSAEDFEAELVPDTKTAQKK